jgi:hypothetical protein
MEDKIKDTKALTMDIISWLGPIEKVIGFFNREPKFIITLDKESINKKPPCAIFIWVKNSSSKTHEITRIAIVGKDYELRGQSDPKMPILLSPADPEKKIGLAVDRVSPNSSANIIIKIFSRWNGEEVEAGNSRI